MEQNLPFIQFGPANKGYNHWVIPFLGRLDDGKVFSTIINWLMQLLAYAYLLGGIYLTLFCLFGENGFIQNAITADTFGSSKAGAGVGMILGILVSLFVAWMLYSVVRKRANQIAELSDESLLNYFFVKVIPKWLTLIGELAFILFLYAGVMQLIATMVGSYAYAPLSKYAELLVNVMCAMFDVDGLDNIIPNNFKGSYINWKSELMVSLVMFFSGFAILVGYYIFAELYKYGMKLLANLIVFLPKFAIPIAIRNRSEN